jgi:hypothetical protein
MLLWGAATGVFILVAALSGCSVTNHPPAPSPAVIIPATFTPTLEPYTSTPTSAPTEFVLTPGETATSESFYDPSVPDSWKNLPVIPETVSQKMIDLYKKGQESGNNKRAFSKAGDCETSSEYFLSPFDLGPKNYTLGSHSDLQEVINHFRGSFGRVSIAAKPSFSVSSMFTSLWSDPALCGDEYPISCEYRINRPAFALIMFGTNDVHNSPDVFEKNLRALIEFSLKNHVIPILATKADNLEGDGRINATIAQLAYEYEVPVWNFWRAVQGLPGNGMKEDQVHFTYAPNDFDNPDDMLRGWPVRNLTALQVLDKVWRTVAAANGETY